MIAPATFAIWKYRELARDRPSRSKPKKNAMTMKMKVIFGVLTVAAFATACSKSEPGSTGVTTAPAAATRLEVTVTENGFEPDKLTVPRGKPVTLVFTRKTDKTCAKEVVLDTGDGQRIKKDLPLDTPVELVATFPTAGELKYACGMDMVTGVLTVQ